MAGYSFIVQPLNLTVTTLDLSTTLFPMREEGDSPQAAPLSKLPVLSLLSKGESRPPSCP
jgi:hypothetical protein